MNTSLFLDLCFYAFHISLFLIMDSSPSFENISLKFGSNVHLAPPCTMAKKSSRNLDMSSTPPHTHIFDCMKRARFCCCVDLVQHIHTPNLWWCSWLWLHLQVSGTSLSSLAHVKLARPCAMAKKSLVKLKFRHVTKAFAHIQTSD